VAAPREVGPSGRTHTRKNKPQNHGAFFDSQKVAFKTPHQPHKTPQTHHDLPPQISAKSPLTPKKAQFSRPDI
jgi:hypothetical protein